MNNTVIRNWMTFHSDDGLACVALDQVAGYQEFNGWTRVYLTGGQTIVARMNMDNVKAMIESTNPCG